MKLLSRLFRRLMLEMLLAAHDAGRLQFFGDYAHLASKAAFKAYLAPLHRTKWFVYSKRPFAGPEQVLAYLSRYTHRVAIGAARRPFRPPLLWAPVGLGSASFSWEALSILYQKSATNASSQAEPC